MSVAAIDACCLIDLLASGYAEEILKACGLAWNLPVAVHVEVQYVRQHDPADPANIISVPFDFAALLSSGLLTPCQPDNQQEQDAFTQYATQFRSDGEAMCLALAECRGWSIATDDRKAIRVAKLAGLTVFSSPQLIKTWADVMGVELPRLRKALLDVELLARFRPNTSMPECQWWDDQFRP